MPGFCNYLADSTGWRAGCVHHFADGPSTRRDGAIPFWMVGLAGSARLRGPYCGRRRDDFRGLPSDLYSLKSTGFTGTTGATHLKKVRLGKSGLEVSALAMGSDLIGSKIDRAQSFKLFDFYHEKGGSFLDPANFYSSWMPGCSGWESETTIGAWMRERKNRDEIIISSKLAFDYPGCAGGLSAGEI